MKTRMHSLSLIVKLILAAMFIPLFGGAQRLKFGQTFQQSNNLFEISVIHDERSKMVLPIGVYRVPNTSYLFWSPKKGTPFFGVVGILIDDHNTREGMKDKVSNEEAFNKINLDSITTQSIKAKLQSHEKYILGATTGEKNILKVRPCSWIIIKDKNYEMTFEFEAHYFDETGDEKWRGYYAYAVTDAKPLLGEESLTSNNGELLNDLAQRGVSKCIDALFEDLKGPATQWKNDSNIPKELNEHPKESLLFALPKNCVLLQETTEDWIIKQPLTGLGYCVKIIGKDAGRLVVHPIKKI